MTRNEKILKHLKSGRSITNMSATKHYSVTSLQEAIRDLREQGHTILTQMKTRNGKRYGLYVLVGELRP